MTANVTVIMTGMVTVTVTVTKEGLRSFTGFNVLTSTGVT
jgi:hypothetical protein